jgi:RNA polymerase sigma-70 factor (ECF subfamily)
MDEKALVTNIINGDQNSFKQLYDVYHPYVYNICYRFTGNREDAEDTTQDVFIKIYHAIAKFKGDAKLSTWIYRIAVNTYLKKERRKKLDYWFSLDFLSPDKEKLLPVSPEDLPDRRIEILETERIVQRAVQQLPAKQRTALILHRYENLKYEEIAEIMNTSISAVESLLHRAKENLAKKLIPLKKSLN